MARVHSQGGDQVRLAQPDPADEHDVGGLFDEAKPEQVLDLELIDLLRPGPVERFEGFLHRESGETDAPLDRVTSAPKPNTFERLIQALIFAIIVEALGTFASLAGWVEDETWEAVEPSGAVVLAIIVGFALAVLANKDAQVDPGRSTNPLPTPDPSRRPPPPSPPPPPTR